MLLEMELKGKTISERIFEAYLLEHGITPRYEEGIKDIKRPVDYSFEIQGVTFRCDAKEWEIGEPMQVAGAIDAYGPIRDKIEDGRVKFQEYKGRDEVCCVVLFNPGYQPIFLDEITVYGAMLGDLGMVFKIATEGPAALESEPAATSFLSGGKMVHRKEPLGKGRPQNKTISAVVVPQHFNLSCRVLGVEVARHEKETKQEQLRGVDRLKMVIDVSERMGKIDPVLRVKMYDNPVAVKIPPAAFPAGPYDERFGLKDARLTRIYAGPKLLELEAAERAAGLDVEDPLGMKS